MSSVPTADMLSHRSGNTPPSSPARRGFETSKDKLGEQQFAAACFPAVLMSRLNSSGISAAGTDAPLSSYNVRLVTSGLDPKESP